MFDMFNISSSRSWLLRHTLWFTSLACRPGYPELSKSYMDMASQLFTFTFTFTFTFIFTRLRPQVHELQVQPQGRCRPEAGRPWRHLLSTSIHIHIYIYTGIGACRHVPLWDETFGCAGAFALPLDLLSYIAQFAASPWAIFTCTSWRVSRKTCPPVPLSSFSSPHPPTCRATACSRSLG